MARSEPLCLFPFTEPGLCTNTGVFLAQTLNRQLEDCEDPFTEFDKKCMGLKLRTVPLNENFETGLVFLV